MSFWSQHIRGAHLSPLGVIRLTGQIAIGFWHLLVRNRMAIALASLIWLIFRSGTQPRRLSYPCQQVAAVNVGAFLCGLVPALWLTRKKRAAGSTPRHVTMKRQIIAAGIMFMAAIVTVETYQFAQSLTPPDLPDVPKTGGSGSWSPVGVSHRDVEAGPLSESLLRTMVREAINSAGGLASVASPGNSVVIKPNLVKSTYNTTQGLNTDARIVAEIVVMLKEIGVTDITIAEGTAVGGSYPNSTRDAFQNCGYGSGLAPIVYDPPNNQDPQDTWRFAYDNTVKLRDLNWCGGLHQHDPAYVTLVNYSNGAIRNQMYVPNILLNCDVLISVPTLKNHGNGGVTLSLKNRVGCAPADMYHGDSSWGAGKFGKLGLVHECADFPCTEGDPPADENEIVQRMIVDLNLVRPIDFAVVDGRIGCTDGPSNYSPPSPEMRLIAAGRDPLAVDTACTLMMGYDPDYILHLAWADSTNQLGTMDRSLITLTGERMWKIRQNWTLVHPSAPEVTFVRAKTSLPSINETSATEGQTLQKGLPITASGFSTDTVQVTASATVLGDNLLANGGFDGTSTGWTEWQENSGWGSGEYWQYDNPDTGDGSDYCLRLGNENTSSSFGVYQTVTVQPGKTYRVDAMWKGEKMVDMNWWEVILIDGPFSYLEADTDPDVRDNYMYAYDNNTYGWPGGIGTGWDWEWCHEDNAPPLNQVDWNNRAGRRTATGNVMTVVLKAGAYPGTQGIAAWFDNVSLREVQHDVVLASNPNPTSPATLVLDTDVLPSGEVYPAELRVTAFDTALNEDSVYRNVSIKTIMDQPWLCADTNAMTHDIFVGTDLQNPDSFDAWNCGLIGSDLAYSIDWGGEPWMEVTPAGATSIGGDPANTHTVSYTTANLLPGIYETTIVVTNDSLPTNFRTIDVTLNVETVKADIERDGDVDQTDFGLLQPCLNNSTPATGECLSADLNNDGYVNSVDVTILEGCMSGSNVFPQPDCMP